VPSADEKAARTVPAFPKEEGTWCGFQPQFGVPVPEGTHSIWVRVYIPPDTDADESLFFSTVDQAIQIFLDGVSIYRYGDVNPHRYGSSYGRKWHLIPPPPRAGRAFPSFSLLVGCVPPVTLFPVEGRGEGLCFAFLPSCVYHNL